MIRRRLNAVNFLLKIAILLLPLLSFLIAGYIRFLSGLIPLTSTNISAIDYVGLLLFTTLVWAVVVDHYGLFKLDHFAGAGTSARAVFSACCVTYVAVIGTTFFYRSTSFSRLFVGISALCLFVLAVASERFFNWALDRARHGGSKAQLLIIGADEFARRTAESLLDNMMVPCEIAAFVPLPGQEVAVTGVPLIELQDVRKVAAAQELDDIVIAVPTSRFSAIPVIIQALENICVPVRAVLDLGKNVNVREMLFSFGGVRLLDLRGSPSESTLYLVAKRSFDVVFSLVVLILLSPLMAMIAAAVRLTSLGPVLFTQERVGLSGRIFQMYKFRTMRVGDQQESDTRWTTADDPRRTSLGSFLRRTNLDELPQFFNVLRGEMSIVGPRPERPHFVEEFLEGIAQYNTRHYLKVGITGWAQVNGWRGDTSISRRVEHDLYYLRNWSLLFDFKIILLTVFRTFAANKNAY
ncbi:MAG: undecaprenyl-phosphate glucose phosphotransferase [Terriglobia bacterium]